MESASNLENSVMQILAGTNNTEGMRGTGDLSCQSPEQLETKNQPAEGPPALDKAGYKNNLSPFERVRNWITKIFTSQSTGSEERPEAQRGTDNISKERGWLNLNGGNLLAAGALVVSGYTLLQADQANKLSKEANQVNGYLAILAEESSEREKRAEEAARRQEERDKLAIELTKKELTMRELEMGGIITSQRIELNGILRTTSECGEPPCKIAANAEQRRIALERLIELERGVLGDGKKVLIQNMDLSELRLQEIDFSEIVFESVNFKNSALDWANFQGAHVHRSNLRGAYFHDANLKDAYFSISNFEGAKFTYGNFTNFRILSNVSGAEFLLANLSGADLSKTYNLTQKQLTNACGDEETKLPEGLTVLNCPEEK